MNSNDKGAVAASPRAMRVVMDGISGELQSYSNSNLQIVKQTKLLAINAIIEAARALNEIDCDLLKLEYPGSPEGCRRLAEVLDRPWAVLSAGVPFDDFTEVLQVAFDEGGASGFIAGRSVWRESLPLSGDERQRFLADVARPRLERLVAVAADRARPYTELSG